MDFLSFGLIHTGIRLEHVVGHGILVEETGLGFPADPLYLKKQEPPRSVPNSLLSFGSPKSVSDDHDS